MRELNEKQKKLLDDWLIENDDKVGIFFDLAKCDSFSLALLEKVEAINNFETIHSQINNYISEKVSES